jgi:hypothetical protein
MTGVIRIYCINSEYPDQWGSLTAADSLRLYNILLDGTNVGAISSEWTKEYPVEPGRHQVSINISRRRSSPPLDVDVPEGRTLSLICGINRKGDLFIEPDRPPSAVEQKLVEEQPLEKKVNYRASIWMLLRVLLLLGFSFLYLAVVNIFHPSGFGGVLILFLSCVLLLLVVIGISWLYNHFISSLPKQ